MESDGIGWNITPLTSPPPLLLRLVQIHHPSSIPWPLQQHRPHQLSSGPSKATVEIRHHLLVLRHSPISSLEHKSMLLLHHRPECHCLCCHVLPLQFHNLHTPHHRPCHPQYQSPHPLCHLTRFQHLDLVQPPTCLQLLPQRRSLHHFLLLHF